MITQTHKCELVQSTLNTRQVTNRLQSRKMDQTSLNNHYKDLAEEYDDSFTKLSAEGESNNKFDFGGENSARLIVKLLDLKPDDRMVDLGAGTCRTAGMVANIAGLKHPVLCVDPVQEMLNVAKKNNIEKIETLCATADQFAKKDMKYDKLLIKGAVHHFPVDKMREIFTGIEAQLNKKGTILINKAGANRTGGMPFFKKGMEYRSSTQAGITELLENILGDLGFQIEKQVFEDDATISKNDAIESIKNRSLSSLSAMSEEELKEGIEEVERNYGDFIYYKQIWEMIIAQKN